VYFTALLYRDMNILIIGMGVGGLTLANFLQHREHKLTLIDRNDGLNIAGSGIVLQPNAVHVLRLLDLEPDIQRLGQMLKRSHVEDFKGNIQSKVDLTDEIEAKMMTYSISRSAFYNLMYHRLLPQRCEFLFKTIVNELKVKPNSVHVTLSNGQEREYDLVVGADGSYSSTRQELWGQIEKRFSGHVGWRTIVPRVGDIALDRLVEMIGHDKRVWIAPVSSTEVYLHFVATASQNSPVMRNISVGSFKELFKEFQGPVPALLQHINSPEQLWYNELEDFWIEAWHNGRVVLIGDAAHTVMASLGQGGAMAIEDARALDFALNRSENDVPKALKLWEDLRRDRIKKIRDLCFEASKSGQQDNTVLRRLRQSFIRLVANKNGNKRSHEVIYGDQNLEQLLKDQDLKPKMSPEAEVLVRYLAYLGYADGGLSDYERSAIITILNDLGEQVSHQEVSSISQTARHLPIENILSSYVHETIAKRESIVQMGLALCMADKQYHRDEVATMRRVGEILKISPARMLELQKDIVASAN
jgi:2-polyprenyl-6-methoxyphenol hydroxylase-like FAD-dependent oxidoreductase/uncharacterized tellurite resistance protein B-like protein